jgi:uncharacterized membrane protein
MEALRHALAPHYLELKALHLFAVMAWIWSTSVAYLFFVVPVFKAWRRNPHDLEVIALRDWVAERFDRGAIIEHVAFPVILVTGPLLYWVGGWDTSATWLTFKLLVVVGILIPIEVFDYHLSHLGGNKRKAQARGGDAERERKLHQHWWFLLISTPYVIFFLLLIVFLAVTKYGAPT